MDIGAALRDVILQFNYGSVSDYYDAVTEFTAVIEAKIAEAVKAALANKETEDA